MSKQQEAPGELEHVRAFVNTIDLEERTEELAGPDALAAWLSEHGLAPAGLVATNADVEYAIGLREALRAVLLAHNADGFVPADVAIGARPSGGRSELRLRFDSDGGSGTLEPEAEGVDGALGRLLAIIHRADRRRHLDAPEGMSRRHLRVGVLRPHQEPLGRLVQHGRLRQQGQGARIPRRRARGRLAACKDDAVPSFCRHNRLIQNCPICSREQAIELRPVVSSSAPRTEPAPAAQPELEPCASYASAPSPACAAG